MAWRSELAAPVDELFSSGGEMHATIVFARHLQGRPCPELEGVHRERTWWHQEVFAMNLDQRGV